MPSIASAFARLPARVAQIDGELCLCNADGRPDFRALMRAARQHRIMRPGCPSMPSICCS
jgi:ATP-dependent DNA ligase